MFRWAIAFFVLAIVAAFFGFGGIAVGAASIAKLLFFGFLLIAGISMVAGLLERKTL